MQLSVFGLGYVGCVSIGCLAQNGHKVVGIDINPYKVELIKQGKPTIIEKDIDNLIKTYHQNGQITATVNYKEAVSKTEMSFICVGTPSLPTGQLNLDYVFNTAKQIAGALKEKHEFFVVVIRSTVFPGTNTKIAGIIESISGKKLNRDFAVVSNPEFLREGSAVEDYNNPALTVVGTESDKATQMMREIYANITTPMVVTDVKAAEMIKYVNNAFHALKISFANEVGNICKEIGVDAFKVMELFKMDDRLNISPAYFNPGMAYGGSCLPKDLKGLSTIAHDNYIETPVLNAIAISNENQKRRVLRIVQKQKQKCIGVLGLAFKKGTDDLRYSPTVDLIEGLIGKGYQVKIYDKNVMLSRLVGANKSYIEEHLPHISNLLTDNLNNLLSHSETLVVAHVPDTEEYDALKNYKGKILDLVKLDTDQLKSIDIEGLSW